MRIVELLTYQVEVDEASPLEGVCDLDSEYFSSEKLGITFVLSSTDHGMSVVMVQIRSTSNLRTIYAGTQRQRKPHYAVAHLGRFDRQITGEVWRIGKLSSDMPNQGIPDLEHWQSPLPFRQKYR